MTRASEACGVGAELQCGTVDGGSKGVSDAPRSSYLVRALYWLGFSIVGYVVETGGESTPRPRK